MSKDKETKAVIDMVKYNDSSPIHERCKGCNRIFEHTYTIPDTDVVLNNEKCLAYINPASKWPRKGEKFAMMTATVREVGVKKGNALVEKEIPVTEKFCPLASHFVPIEVVNTSSKTRAGQQKQK